MLTYFPKHAAPRGGEANEGARRSSSLRRQSAGPSARLQLRVLVNLLYMGPARRVGSPWDLPWHQDAKVRRCGVGFAPANTPPLVTHSPACFLLSYSTPHAGVIPQAHSIENSFLLLFPSVDFHSRWRFQSKRREGHEKDEAPRLRPATRVPWSRPSSGRTSIFPQMALLWSLGFLSESGRNCRLPGNPNDVRTQYARPFNNFKGSRNRDIQTLGVERASWLLPLPG